MHDEISIAEAKNKLPSIIHRVEKGPYIKLTRRGKPVAILLSIKEYEWLSQKKTGLWEALSKFREQVKEINADITDSEFEDLRDADPGRKVEI
jgi:prevent-host-death family protein